MPKSKSITPANPNYAASRSNATTHGIHSTQTVLPWEDNNEYEALQAEFVAEYSPEGPTETRLVTEIGDIFWRKQRLKMAEAGAVRNSLSKPVHQHGRSLNSVSWPSTPYSESTHARDDDRLDLLSLRPNEVRGALDTVEAKLSRISAAIEVDNRSGDIEKILKAIPEDLCRDYADIMREYDLDPNNNADKDETDYCFELEGVPVTEYEFRQLKLRELLNNRRGKLKRLEYSLAHYREIHEGALFDVIEGSTYEKIARYESHLDRKFKDKLSLLLQIQQFRKKAVAVDTD